MSALLDDPSSSGDGFALLLGSGVLGSAISGGLRYHGRSRARSINIPWESRVRADILERSAEAMSVTSRARDAIVWAAGRAGFSSDKRSCEEELAAFADVVGAVEQIVEHRGPQTVSFHMVSSAGGLFEGVTRVSRDSPVTPRRPYGFMKLQQEDLALRLSTRIPVSIYRVSTVYSSPRPGQRVGLIGELIRNGLDRRPISIYGAMDTLRDYVGNEEVGRHIAQRIMSQQAPGPAIEMVIAGQPTPIAAVVDVVQRLIRRKLLVSFEDAWNARDITFDPSIRAAGFHPEALRVGVSRALFQFMTTR